MKMKMLDIPDKRRERERERERERWDGTKTIVTLTVYRAFLAPL
jgi:hypothetical protein